MVMAAGGASGEGFECHDVVARGCHAVGLVRYQQVDPPLRFPLAAAVVAAIDIPPSVRAQMDSGTHMSSISVNSTRRLVLQAPSGTCCFRPVCFHGWKDWLI